MDIVDVTVRVDAALSDPERQRMEERLRAVAGVVAPRFNRDHELVVAYDPAATDSAAILAAAREHSPGAALVGM